ncbi:PKD domain-containing protein [Longimicrobium sp.]|uniref:PKD domain-containing protein n=1 Tax=Longimicrobium sp. TaxID=2029185 RepID=UPI002E35E188|nr:PKD domain-containing protein [Longimicrobium sp.]HEX6036934.1 PKD domain-containing protein [Longimicrobium sp.]
MRMSVRALPLLALGLAACADNVAAPEQPAPAPPPPSVAVEALQCSADVRGRALECDPASPALGSARGTIIGGQGTHVRLRSSNVAYDSAAGVFRLDATIQNLMADRTLGTYDGVNVAGIRVFFHAGPNVVEGSGEVGLANTDGENFFLGAGEPFFNYASMLGPDATTEPRQWRFDVPTGVERFVFTVYLEAPVFDNRPHPPTYGIYRQMTAGFSHACGLLNDGRIFCWGDGSGGKLGHGGTRLFLDPAPVAGTLAWRLVTAGDEHTCGVTTDNQPYCWGNGATAPAALYGLATVDSMDAGGTSTCATRAGTAYCWGTNEWGQLGTGDFATHDAPTPVAGGHAFVDVRVGSLHACGLEADGEVWCWGMNQFGQLGADASQTCGTAYPYPCSSTPLKVDTELRFTRLDAGRGHTCALTAEGEAYCWGVNSHAQVGTGSGEDANRRPGRVLTNARFRRIVAMDRTSCGIGDGGVTECWGANPGSVTQPVEDVVGDRHWASLAGAHEHVCGATLDGQGFCTGREQFGELGNLGTHQNVATTPAALAPLHVRDLPPRAGLYCETGGYAEAVCRAREDPFHRFFTSYSDDDYGIVTRIWSWGDGSPPEEGELVRHNYTANGQYVITLMVVDAAGQRSMTQENVWVYSLP